MTRNPRGFLKIEDASRRDGSDIPLADLRFVDADISGDIHEAKPLGSDECFEWAISHAAYSCRTRNPLSIAKLEIFTNDLPATAAVELRMKKPQPTPEPLEPEPPRKQGRRPHYIPAWASSIGMNQADLVRALGADKGSVSKWFKGATPQEHWQKKLADLFDTTTDGIFRHPDEAWVAGFLSGRSQDEINRMKATLSAAFPKKSD